MTASSKSTQTLGKRFLGDLVPPPGPARVLGTVTLAHTVGLGIYATVLVIFLTKDRGLSPHDVGVVLSIAGGLGFFASVPAGWVVDRLGPRRCVLVTYVLLGALLLMLAASESLVMTAPVIAGLSVVETANSPMRAALVFRLFGAAAGTRVRAQMRSISNAGFAAGALVASIALAVDTHPAYVVSFAVAGVSYLSCTLLLRRLPVGHQNAPSAARHEGRAIRDFRFLAVALVSGVLEFHVPLLLVGIPAWIVSRTDVPAAWQSGLMVLNTVLIVLLQVRASRGAETALGAATLQRRSGLVLAGCCLVYAVSQYTDIWLTIVLLFAGTLVLTWGELMQAAGAYGLAFTLPPAGRQGEYQGVFALGRGLQSFLGPIVITSTVIAWGLQGWLVLAVIFVVAGFLSPVVTAAVLQRRTGGLDPDGENAGTHSVHQTHIGARNT